MFLDLFYGLRDVSGLRKKPSILLLSLQRGQAQARKDKPQFFCNP